MEYDCHTMLYIIHKKDEYENGKNKDFRINNKNN